jgi:hypothetical protein
MKHKYTRKQCWDKLTRNVKVAPGRYVIDPDVFHEVKAMLLADKPTPLKTKPEWEEVFDKWFYEEFGAIGLNKEVGMRYENIRNFIEFILSTKDKEVLTAYENPTKSKEMSVEDMQKIVDANEKLVKELKNAKD